MLYVNTYRGRETDYRLYFTRCCFCFALETKGLVINYGEAGGYKTGGGGAFKVLPLQKRGAEKVLAMLKGGGAQQVCGYFFTR